MTRPCAALLATVLALAASAEAPRVVIDNPWVKVTRFSLAPGESQDLSVQGEAVTIWLTAWKAQREVSTGRPDMRATMGHDREAGRVEHRMPERLPLTNVGGQRAEAVTIELKDGAPPVEGPYPDGPEAAPENITCLYENDRIRVLRIRVGGNDALPMHGHSRRVVVEMTGSSFVTSADSGGVRGQDFSAGTTAWIDRVTWHREINTSGVPYERVNVELKSGAQPIQRVKAGGRVFGVTDRGQGDRVVLVHDVAGDVLAWEAVAARLAQRHRVVAYSRRGHFPNDRLMPGEAYDLRSHAGDLAELLSTLPGGPATLVGHGTGAAVALRVAQAHPNLVKRVVLVEPEPAWDAHEPEATRALLETVLKQGNEPLALEAWVLARWAPWQFKNLPVPVQERLRANESTVLPYLAQKPEPAPQNLPKAPVTLLLGEGHGEAGALLRRRFPAVAVETLPGAGRALPWVQAEGLAAALLRILDRP